MAWLQNLADKAEDLLNKIDKNAATVLNDNLPKTENTQIEITTEVLPRRPNGLINVIPSVKSLSILSDTDVIDQSTEDDTRESLDNSGISILSNQTDQVNNEIQISNSNSTIISRENSFHMVDEYQINYEERMLKLETENRELNKQLLNLHHLYSELQNENVNILNQLERANESVITAQNEMEQYKSRAQRVLQEKEKLLSSSTEGTLLLENESDKFLNNYNSQLKEELAFQQTRNGELNKKVDTLNNALSDLQKQYFELQTSHQLSIQNIQESLNNEKKMRSFVEEECRLKTKELQSALTELSETKNLLILKGNELKEARNRLRDFTGIGNTNDVESRLHSLTQTLMVKQNTLETVTSERNALRIQLEKIENEFQKAITQNRQLQVVVTDVNETDDVKSQVPRFMVPSPFDAGMTRRVKHAYSTLDAISVRTGVFLRRYPLARVFVFSYMVNCFFLFLHNVQFKDQPQIDSKLKPNGGFTTFMDDGNTLYLYA